MIVCKLKCGNCDYESDPFVEGYSVHSDAHTVLCVNRETNAIRIAKLKNSEIGEDVNTDDRIEAFAVCDGEYVVKTQLGQEEELDIFCPFCNQKGVVKAIVGVQ